MHRETLLSYYTQNTTVLAFMPQLRSTAPENGRDMSWCSIMRTDPAFPGFSNKTGLKTSEKTACQIPLSLASSRHNATVRKAKTRRNTYLTLMLLYYCCFLYLSLLSLPQLQSWILYLMLRLQNPTIPDTTALINIKLSALPNTSLVTDTQHCPPPLNTSWISYWHINSSRKAASRRHFCSTVSYAVFKDTGTGFCWWRVIKC